MNCHETRRNDLGRVVGVTLGVVSAGRGGSGAGGGAGASEADGVASLGSSGGQRLDEALEDLGLDLSSLRRQPAVAVAAAVAARRRRSSCHLRKRAGKKEQSRSESLF